MTGRGMRLTSWILTRGATGQFRSKRLTHDEDAVVPSTSLSPSGSLVGEPVAPFQAHLLPWPQIVIEIEHLIYLPTILLSGNLA
jgi:hypothetical protein